MDMRRRSRATNAVRCLESLGEVCHNDALAREEGLSPEKRMRFHQERNGPVREELQALQKAIVHRKNPRFIGP